MATMFGRFEIQSEISKSDTSVIYKALDCKTNQIVALKTQSLKPLGESREDFCARLDRRRRAQPRTRESEHCCALRGGRNRRPVLRFHGVCTGQQHCHDAGAQRRVFDLGSARYFPPGVYRSRSRGQVGCGALVARTGQDHGAVGWAGENCWAMAFRRWA